MHRLTATPGGWNPNTEGVIIVDQTPAPIVFLTSADTDIQTLAQSLTYFPSNFPEIRVNNLLNLQQQLSIDTYVEKSLSEARVIILRLLGGRTYWSYGLESVKEITEATGAALWVLPGDDRPDPDLISHSTVALAAVNQLWRYFTEGGIKNYINAFCFVSDICLKTNYQPPQPRIIPRLGLYSYLTKSKPRDRVGILFYRSHYLAGNTLVIDALCEALVARNLEPLPIFISSLREKEVQAELLNIFQSQPIQILLNTTSFALAKINDESQIQFWQQLNIPVLQVILSGSTKAQWETSWQGLTPRDVAMNVALPEVDGRIITTAISFKSIKNWQEKLETDVVIYQPDCDRINFVADLAANWVKLKQTPLHQRKVALILANYPNKDGRIANGVGLDTPASCIEILTACAKAGYLVEDLPASGDELIRLLTTGITNDLESRHIRPVYQSLSVGEYQQYFQTLPEKVQQEIVARWDNVGRIRESPLQNDQLSISGIQLGNIFVGIQPSRGYDRDPSLNYHAPDLEPTHEYLAYYYWLREKFQVQAIVHVGKHGNLEWLPGKSLALSSSCYPEVALQAIPNIYPFIVNDPGEGSQAKRRSQAVIIDHLTPPLTRAELYDGLAKLETLIDEYYEAQTLDPSRLPTISDRITQLIQQENLDRDLGIKDLDTQSISQFLTVADGYLCELKEAQIRDGLHIFGQCPQGRQLKDLILAIARFPNLNRLGLTSAIALDLGLDFDPLNWREEEAEEKGRRGDEEKRRWIDITDKLGVVKKIFTRLNFKSPQNLPDVVEILELIAAELVEELIEKNLSRDRCIDAQIDNKCSSALISASQSMSTDTHGLTQINYQRLSTFISGSFTHTHRQLQWIETQLLPSLQQTNQEITNLLNALDGKYVPSGASGAPTRGRPEVLPTGRNFYSVDIRAIPTETAWAVGSKAAEAVIERYTQENGEYPQSLAISIWGTSTMRTGGDDIAQVMALMGVRPIWDNFSRRVVDFEILSPAVLGRPRVDVTVRVSGFFRDSFPNILNLFNNITKAIASLEESPEINPLSAQVNTETEFWQQQGLDEQLAFTRASYRVFGSKPGAYGAGLQGLIESQNWQTDEDLARAYLNWSSYAYDAKGNGHSAPEAFGNRLKQLQIVLQNQDNREHDLLDSDDYYQFQGGLTAAVRSVTGKNPIVYFGDNSLPNHPRVKKLSEEIAKVYRSRVINPKWIAGVMRHGYKGAFEMAATVDYLFAYDATTKCVPDYMYEGIAQAYILNEQVQQFIQDKNPWALRDLAERLLEANQRGMWREVQEEMLEELRNIVNHAEGIIEGIG
ncbi:cobaltochelatase [Stanieria sp. NIES-3757]|nr:cobaltochelatase [Stanieria sp. NIES-3757]